MDHLSGRRQRLWEAMESCRIGSDDLSDPQFADLATRLTEDPELRGQFQRLQAADRAIKVAFLADVPVPAGLANRVSQRVAEAAQGASEVAQRVVEAGQEQAEAAPTAISDTLAVPAVTVPAISGPVTTGPDSPTPLPEPAARFSRRRLLVGFTAISAATILFALVWNQTHLPRQETPDNVLDEAMEFFGNDNQPPGDRVLDVPPPAEYPMSGDIVVRLQNIRWRHVAKFPGGPAVAYDLPLRGGRATLYVLQRNVPGLQPIPPSQPKSTTGGMSAAAWQAGNTLYILVVEGDAGTYRRCLDDQSHGPLT